MRLRPLARMARIASRARGLSAREWSELLRAQVALGRAWLSVRFRATGRLIGVAGSSPPIAPGPVERQQALRLARAVHRAARYGPLPSTCLVRAVALHGLLERRGLRGSRIRIGVSRADADFTAHAWVEYADLELEDGDLRPRGLTPLPDIPLVSRA